MRQIHKSHALFQRIRHYLICHVCVELCCTTLAASPKQLIVTLQWRVFNHKMLVNTATVGVFVPMSVCHEQNV